MRHLLNLTILLLAGLTFFGYGIGKRDLWAPDEPRFGQVTREMLQRLHSPDPEIRKEAPFVLHVNNEPYSDKPPLFIWTAALLNGGDGSTVSNAAIRAPSVAGAILGLWVTYALGVLFFGSWRAGLLSALVLSSTLMYSWQACRAQLDMYMAGWSYLAVLGFWMAHNSKSGGRRIAWFALFWAAAGLGILTKGFPGLLVPLGAAGFFLMWEANARKTLWTGVAWSVMAFSLTLLAKASFMQGNAILVAAGVGVGGLLLFSAILWGGVFLKRRSAVLSLVLFLLGLGLSLAIVGVWFFPYQAYGPKAVVEDTLVSQNLTRYLAAEQHQEGVHFFVVSLTHNLLPWTLFFVAAAALAWRGSSQMASAPRRFLSSWILFTVVFFSITPGKRDQYMLPCIPAFALFCGWFFDRALRAPTQTLRRWVAIPGYVNGAACAVAAVLLGLTGFVFNAPGGELEGWRGALAQRLEATTLDLSIAPFTLAAVAFAILAVVLILGSARRRVWSVAVGSTLLLGGASFFLNGWVYPAVNPRKSGRPISELIMKTRTRPDAPVGVYGLFRAEYQLYGDYFFTRIKGQRQQGDPALQAFLRQPRQAFVLMRGDEYDELKAAYPDLPMRVLFKESIGSRSLVLIDNQAAKQ